MSIILFLLMNFLKPMWKLKIYSGILFSTLTNLFGLYSAELMK